MIVRFWMDRAVRLMPALILVVVAGTAAKYVANDTRGLFSHAVRALCSLENTTFFRNGRNSPFEHTWSLACEEQFYLFWCLTLPYLATCSNRMRGYIVFTLFATSFFSRWYSASHLVFSFFQWNRGLGSVGFKMLFGASFRLVPFPRTLTRAWASRFGLFLIAIAALSPLTLVGKDKTKVLTLLFDCMACVGAALVITSSLKHQSAILSLAPLSFLGRISYAGYLWPTMIILVNKSMYKGYPAVTDTALGLLFATASTFWMEEPLRRRYRTLMNGS